MKKLFLFITLAICCLSADAGNIQNVDDVILMLANDEIKLKDSNFVTRTILSQPQHNIGVSVCRFNASSSTCAANGKLEYGKQLCKGRNFTTETAFDIGSVTKMFAAACLLRLLQEKPLFFPRDLDTNLFFYMPFLRVKYYNSKYVRNLVNRPQFWDITLRNILQHTAGIGDYDYQDKFFYGGDKLISLEEYLGSELDASQYFGSFNYSNVGYNLLGMILNSITGKPFSKLVKQYIIKPLNLQHTFTNEDLINGENGVEIADEKRKKNVVLAQSYSYYKGDWYFTKRPNWDASDGAMFSTANDIAKFVYHFFQDENNLLFNARTRALRDLPSVLINTKRSHAKYGMGYIIFKNGQKGHSGFDTNVDVIASYDTKKKSSFAVGITSEDMTGKLGEILVLSENPNAQESNDYIEQRLKFVDELRNSYTFEQLLEMRRIADISKTIFLRSYKSGFWSKQNLCN